MTTDQVSQAAATVVAEIGHVQGLHEITQVFDKVEVGLILAMGVRKLHEYQYLKGKQEEVDIIPYTQLQKKFGANRRTIIECTQGYKYRYPEGVPMKVQFTLSKPEPKPEEEEQHAAAEAKDPRLNISSNGAKLLGPFRTTKSSQSRNMPRKTCHKCSG